MTDWGVKRRELVRRSPEATCPGCFVTRHSYVFQVASPPGTANAPGSSSQSAHVSPQAAPATCAERSEALPVERPGLRPRPSTPGAGATAGQETSGRAGLRPWPGLEPAWLPHPQKARLWLALPCGAGVGGSCGSNPDLALLLPRQRCRWFYVLLHVLHCSNVVIRKVVHVKKKNLDVSKCPWPRRPFLLTGPCGPSPNR